MILIYTPEPIFSGLSAGGDIGSASEKQWKGYDELGKMWNVKLLWRVIKVKEYFQWQKELSGSPLKKTFS